MTIDLVDIRIKTIEHEGQTWNQIDADCQSTIPIEKTIFETMQSLSVIFQRHFELSGIESLMPPLFFRSVSNTYFCTGNFNCIRKFNDLENIQEIVAHHYVHAMLKGIKKPFGQEGHAAALEESCADIFTLVTQKHHLREPVWKTNGWDISKRATLEHYDSSSNDLAIAKNSLIPSHAFYLATCISETSLFGLITTIWYQIMVHPDRQPNETFFDFALKTITFAKQFVDPKTPNYLSMLKILAALNQAWVEVGVLAQSFVEVGALATEEKL